MSIRLTEERRKHITISHIDKEGKQKLLQKTVQDPDMIIRRVLDEVKAEKFFQKTHLGLKYLVAAYKEVDKEDGFILTAYKASKINKIKRYGRGNRRSDGYDPSFNKHAV
ncbi:MAG: hypothetical protein N2V78_03790 [Methanophagales archaeon]|nr:hypothetical protein [Methanophagales archaeon]